MLLIQCQEVRCKLRGGCCSLGSSGKGSLVKTSSWTTPRNNLESVWPERLGHSKARILTWRSKGSSDLEVTMVIVTLRALAGLPITSPGPSSRALLGSFARLIRNSPKHHATAAPVRCQEAPVFSSHMENQLRGRAGWLASLPQYIGPIIVDGVSC